MKYNKRVLTNAAAIVLSIFCGTAFVANAATSGVERKITLIAQIDDSIYVTKPDGHSWYTTEELEAKDKKQTEFTKGLDVRVWTRGQKFNVSMIQPLVISRDDGVYQLQDTHVYWGDINWGQKELVYGKPPIEIVQTTPTDDGYDDIYKLNIEARAPTAVGAALDGSVNGAYSGELVMLFEPTA